MHLATRVSDSPYPARPQAGVVDVTARVMAFLMLLGLAIVSAAVFLIALGLVQPLVVSDAFAKLGGTLGAVATVDRFDRVVIAVVAALVGLIALSLLVARQRLPAERMPACHVVQSDDKGLVLIGAESVESVASQTALRVAGVLDARARVRGRATGPIRLKLRVDVLPGTDVKRIGPRVQDSVMRSVQEGVGLDVRDAVVEVRVVDLEQLAGGQ